MLIFLLFIIPLYVLCGRLHVITAIPGKNTIQIGNIDPSTGQMDELYTYNFPPTECNPGWILNKGKRGQTFGSFWQNSSIVFFAQEHCGTSVSNTTLFFLGGGGPLRELAKFPELDQQSENSPLHYHVEWDYICNFIVVFRNYSTQKDQTTWHYYSYEISLYDGAKRMLPSMGYDVSSCENCWHWVDGVSGIDSAHDWSIQNVQDYNGNLTRDNEATCGNCVFYTLEEQVVAYKSQKPRRLIGRGVHNGSLVINASDRFQMQTMTYLPKSYQTKLGDFFIGIGVCCELSWCPPQCEGHSGHISIVTWDHGNYSYQIPLILPHKIEDVNLEMGIALDQRYPVNSSFYGPRISIWIAKKIYSFEISATEYETIQITNIATSPPLSLDPLLWAYMPY